VEGVNLSGFSRHEFAAMADLSAEEGQLAERESEILKNLMKLRKTRVRDAMTPRTVLFSLPGRTTVDEFFGNEQVMFSRIPVFGEDPDQINGFVLRGDLLLAQACGESMNTLNEFRREVLVLPDSVSLAHAFTLLLRQTSHIAMVVDEYGDLQGILTLEDIFETLLGLEIVDEGDETVDMQELARDRWKRRAEEIGFKSEE
ncbi:CBS domain-containing protein, partial [Pseudomonadota bacterium]